LLERKEVRLLMSQVLKVSLLKDHHTQPINVEDSATGHQGISAVAQVAIARRRTVKMAINRIQGPNLMDKRSQDSDVSVVPSDNVELAEDLAVDRTDIVVAYRDAMDKCRKETTPLVNPKVSVVHEMEAIVLKDRDVAGSDASEELPAEREDLADQAHLAVTLTHIQVFLTANQIMKIPATVLHAEKVEAGVHDAITTVGQDVHETASRAANLHRVKR
jgi:hypothetical protein